MLITSTFFLNIDLKKKILNHMNLLFYSSFSQPSQLKFISFLEKKNFHIDFLNWIINS